MKNIAFVGILGLLALGTSCSSVSSATVAQQNKSNFLKMKGKWQITSVDYDKSYKIKPFDEGADAQCFEGSEWNLVPNNFTGSYSLNGGGNCPQVSQNIKFEVVSGTTFQFKKLVDGVKAKQVLAGYQLTLVDQTETTFSLEQNIPFSGNNVRVVYNFEKIGK